MPKFDEGLAEEFRLTRLAHNKNGKLFPVWGTKSSDLTELGEGVGLYFTYLLTVTGLFLVMSLAAAPAMYYNYLGSVAAFDSDVARWEAGELVGDRPVWGTYNYLEATTVARFDTFRDLCTLYPFDSADNYRTTCTKCLGTRPFTFYNVTDEEVEDLPVWDWRISTPQNAVYSPRYDALGVPFDLPWLAYATTINDNIPLRSKCGWSAERQLCLTYDHQDLGRNATINGALRTDGYAWPVADIYRGSAGLELYHPISYTIDNANTTDLSGPEAFRWTTQEVLDDNGIELGDPECPDNSTLTTAQHTARRQNSQPHLYSYVSGVLTVFVYIGAISVFARKRQRARMANMRKYITAADYTVKVTGLPFGITEDQLYEYFSQWGDVVAITISYADAKQLQALSKRQSLLDQMEGVSLDRLKPGSYAAWQWKRKSRQLEDVNGKVLKYRSRRYKPVAAFITFDAELQASICMAHFRFSFWHLFLCRCQRATSLKGKTVRVKRAPEPSDVIWEHLDYDRWSRRVRNFVTYLVTLPLIALSVAVLTFARSTDSIGEFVAESDFQGASEVAVVAPTLAVALINMAIERLVKMTSFLLKDHSHSSLERSIVIKLVLAPVFNSGLSILLAYESPYNSLWWSRTSIIIFGIIISDVVTRVLVQLLLPGYLMRRFFRSIASTNQMQFNRARIGPVWRISERYAAVLKTQALVLIFFAGAPSVLPIAAASFVITYWVDKFNVLRVYQEPPKIRDRVGLLAMNLMPALGVVAFFSVWLFYGWQVGVVADGFDIFDVALPALGILLVIVVGFQTVGGAVAEAIRKFISRTFCFCWTTVEDRMTGDRKFRSLGLGLYVHPLVSIDRGQRKALTKVAMLMQVYKQIQSPPTSAPPQLADAPAALPPTPGSAPSSGGDEPPPSYPGPSSPSLSVPGSSSGTPLLAAPGAGVSGARKSISSAGSNRSSVGNEMRGEIERLRAEIAAMEANQAEAPASADTDWELATKRNMMAALGNVMSAGKSGALLGLLGPGVGGGQVNEDGSRDQTDGSTAATAAAIAATRQNATESYAPTAKIYGAAPTPAAQDVDTQQAAAPSGITIQVEPEVPDMVPSLIVDVPGTSSGAPMAPPPPSVVGGYEQFAADPPAPEAPPPPGAMMMDEPGEPGEPGEPLMGGLEINLPPLAPPEPEPMPESDMAAPIPEPAALPDPYSEPPYPPMDNGLEPGEVGAVGLAPDSMTMGTGEEPQAPPLNMEEPPEPEASEPFPEQEPDFQE